MALSRDAPVVGCDKLTAKVTVFHGAGQVYSDRAAGLARADHVQHGPDAACR